MTSKVCFLIKFQDQFEAGKEDKNTVTDLRYSAKRPFLYPSKKVDIEWH